MRDSFELIKDCPLFCGIACENLGAVLKCLGAKRATYKKGSTVLFEGEPAKYVGVVLTGVVQIVRMDCFVNRSILATVEPPQLFGEALACAGVESMPVSAVAGADAEIMLVDAQRIIATCGSACEFHSRMIFNLLKIVAQKNLSMNRKLGVVTKRTTREKLMTFLDLQAKKNGGVSFTVPFDRQELADYLEVERSGLSTEISKLRAEGVIECRKNRFTMLRMERV